MIRNRAVNGGRQSKLKKRKGVVKSSEKAAAEPITNIIESKADDNHATRKKLNDSRIEKVSDEFMKNKHCPEKKEDSSQNIRTIQPLVINADLIRSILGWNKEQTDEIFDTNIKDKEPSLIFFPPRRRNAALMESRCLPILGETDFSTLKQCYHVEPVPGHLLKGHGLKLRISSLEFPTMLRSKVNLEKSRKEDNDLDINPKQSLPCTGQSRIDLKATSTTSKTKDEELSKIGTLCIIATQGATVRTSYEIDGSTKICHLDEGSVREYVSKKWLPPDEEDDIDDCIGVYRYKVKLKSSDNVSKKFGWISGSSRLKDDTYDIVKFL